MSIDDACAEPFDDDEPSQREQRERDLELRRSRDLIQGSLATVLWERCWVVASDDASQTWEI
jgi:hypothetical protein